MSSAADKRPSVVVGISTYNRSDVLRKSIQSALQQSHKPLRIAVIDDASTDETPSLRGEFEMVSWERWDENQGYVHARNKMMLTASEDYYVSLDDDAWFLENDEIAIAVNYLECHPNVAAVAFDILSPDEPHRHSRGTRLSVGTFIGCGHVLRLSVVRALGGYAIFPGAYGVEEKDLCLRLIDSGLEIVKLDGVHVWHDKTMTARDIVRQLRSGVCNDLTLAVWRFPGRIILQVLVWKTVVNLVFASRQGHLRSCFLGICDFLYAFGKIWQNRKPVRRSSVALYRALARAPRAIVG
ncbi:MAG: glycosyltransferase [Rhizomicrobium sp.]|jgi:GT2 family glycosyltransferase